MVLRGLREGSGKGARIREGCSLVGFSRKERKVMQSYWDVGPGCSGSHGKTSFGSRILRGGV